MQEFIKKLPKAELHVHIEGTLEPEQLLLFADRNKIKIPFSSVAAVREAYKFTNLQSFLDLYYQGESVLCTEQDFYDLTASYFKKISEQGVVHAEIFFETQTYHERGIAFGTIITGIYAAATQAEKLYGITSALILCFLRHLSEQDAFIALQESLPYRDKIIGIGLASSELGNPPAKFKQVFQEARNYGYHAVVHAGEEAGPDYIWEALTILGAERIDHGVQCMKDPQLVQELLTRKIPLTVCPLSNVALQIYKNLEEHPIKRMLDAGLCVSINSDDPAYFGGYIAENYQAVAECFEMSKKDLIIIARNSIIGSFMPEDKKNKLLNSEILLY